MEAASSFVLKYDMVVSLKMKYCFLYPLSVNFFGLNKHDCIHIFKTKVSKFQVKRIEIATVLLFTRKSS